MELDTSDLPELRGRLSRMQEAHTALKTLPEGPERSKVVSANYARILLLRRAIQRREKRLDTPL